MFCGKCGNKIEDDEKFCPMCGNPISAKPIQTAAQPESQFDKNAAINSNPAQPAPQFDSYQQAKRNYGMPINNTYNQPYNGQP